MLERVKINSLQHMQTKANKLLNPYGYYLSKTAQKKLRWLYIFYYETNGNVTKASNKIGISRQWLSTIKSTFEKYHRDPRTLEPKSKAPYQTDNRERIPKEIDEKPN
jgi:hypothetical protein